MHIVEHTGHSEIQFFIKKIKNIDPNYVNEYGNCLVSVLIKKILSILLYKNPRKNKGFSLNMMNFKRYALTFKALAGICCKYNGFPFFVRENNTDPKFKDKFDNLFVSALITRYYQFFSIRIEENEGFSLRLLKTFLLPII